MTDKQKTENAFQLKGSLFTFTVMRLENDNMSDIETQLQKTVEQAPKFFDAMPLVIDCQHITANSSSENTIDFAKLKALLKDHKIIPVGIRGGNENLQHAANEAELAILPNTKSSQDSTINIEQKNSNDAAAKKLSDTAQKEFKNQTKLITQPVRSGQQIYAKGGDLIILAPVSHGAELLADGHIHVYSSLRGRALAGINGDTSARIFCYSLEAELISIAGHYQVNEQLLDSEHNENPLQNIHIYLDNDCLHIESLK